MKDKLLKVLRFLPYPAFYGLCLLLFGYLTFPFDRLKDRIVAEIGKQGKGKAPVVTMEHLDSYWLTGVELENVKVHLPADDSAASKPSFGAFGMPAPKPEPEKDSVIEIKEAHARARLLPLIIGRVQLDFWASVFGGEVSGSAPAGTTKGDVDLKVEDVKLSEIDPLQNLLGVPIDGRVNGSLSLSPTDGKFSKSTGKIDLSIKNLVVSDGKTKIRGLLAIPPAKVDEIVLAGEAEKGVLKITKLSANGPDLELEGDGKINVRDPWGESSVDLYIKFRFTDAYRGKDGTTRSILGEPGSAATPLIDTTVPTLKKAKRADGFYGFHIHGKLKKLEFTPSSTDASGSGGAPSSPTKKGGKPDSPLAPGGRRLGGVALPLGVSSAGAVAEEEREREKKEREKEADRAEERRGAMPTPVAAPPRQEPKADPNEEPVVPPPFVLPPMPPVVRDGDPPPGDNPAPGQPPTIAPPGADNPSPDQPQQPPSEEPR